LPYKESVKQLCRNINASQRRCDVHGTLKYENTRLILNINSECDINSQRIP
jgi:hypothetical protein